MIENSVSPPSDKRHYSRQPITEYVELDKDNGGIILDASEAGLRIQAVRELEAGCSVRMRFQPNQTNSWIEAKGRIVWTSETRRLAGIEFSDLPDEGRQALRELLREPSWRHASNQGIDISEPNATNQPSVIATTYSEVQGTDSTSIGRFGKGTVSLSKPGVPDVTKQTAPPAGILA
jgi:hypothetical protein